MPDRASVAIRVGIAMPDRVFVAIRVGIAMPDRVFIAIRVGIAMPDQVSVTNKSIREGIAMPDRVFTAIRGGIAMPGQPDGVFVPICMGIAMPESIFAHGWWLTGRTKMSKSLGNVVNPMDMIDNYGVDAFRYFLIAEMTLGQDASFTEEAFVKRYNSDLANDLGNVANRVLSMIGRYCDGKMPAPAGDGFDTELEDAMANLRN